MPLTRAQARVPGQPVQPRPGLHQGLWAPHVVPVVIESRDALHHASHGRRWSQWWSTRATQTSCMTMGRCRVLLARRRGWLRKRYAVIVCVCVRVRALMMIMLMILSTGAVGGC